MGKVEREEREIIRVRVSGEREGGIREREGK